MAVYKKTYQRYEGALTPEWSRFLVMPRYALEEMRSSRFLTLFYSASLLAPLVYAIFIYAWHNLSALKLMQVDPARLIPIDARLFVNYLGLQCMLAFCFTAFIGPGLVSPDLANQALPLYLSRPLTRKQYVIGKMSVLVILLSVMTWIPGLLLFGLQSYLDNTGWFGKNLRIASGIFFGSFIWILVLSLLALAISAWVKWKPVAGAMLFGVFFVAAGFGFVISGILRTRWGGLINIGLLMGTIWEWLFSEPSRRGDGAVFFRVSSNMALPVWCAWAALTAMCLLCLYLLARKIRGAEVIR